MGIEERKERNEERVEAKERKSGGDGCVADGRR